MTIESAFDHWYDAYPRKRARGDALRAWTVAWDDLPSVRRMLEVLDAQKRSTEWADVQWIPYPATYLRDRRWEDEIEDLRCPFHAAGHNPRMRSVRHRETCPTCRDLGADPARHKVADPEPAAEVLDELLAEWSRVFPDEPFPGRAAGTARLIRESRIAERRERTIAGNALSEAQETWHAAEREPGEDDDRPMAWDPSDPAVLP
jgi:hypothetical protein